MCERTGCDNVVDDDDLGTRFDGIALHLEDILAILLLESLRLNLSWKLALLSDRNKSSSQSQCQCRTEQESTALESNNDVDVAVHAQLGVEDIGDLQFEGTHQSTEQIVRGEQRHDVLEENAGSGEIGVLAQAVLELYLKTGEFGGTGGMGGGESSLGGMATGGEGGWIGLGRVGVGRSAAVLVGWRG